MIFEIYLLLLKLELNGIFPIMDKLGLYMFGSIISCHLVRLISSQIYFILNLCILNPNVPEDKRNVVKQFKVRR